MSFGEHLDYQPVIEELAYYVIQWRKQNAPAEATLGQARTLLQFGMQYDIQNPQFWAVVLEIAEQNIGDNPQNFSEVIEFITLMKD